MTIYLGKPRVSKNEQTGSGNDGIFFTEIPLLESLTSSPNGPEQTGLFGIFLSTPKAWKECAPDSRDFGSLDYYQNSASFSHR
jgi:hypothetical protein